MNGLLQLDKVGKRFGDIEVLKDVTLSVAPGERHAVIGPNGAGKTTLTNVITGRFPVTQGAVWFRGERIDPLKPYQRVRRGIGRSFQIINVFREMTVFENVRNAVLAKHGIRFSLFKAVRQPAVEEEVDELVNLVGLRRERDRLASTLPYGAQRALEIGLALAQDPQLVILDEPAAGLTAAETRDVTELIRRTTEGRTLILIEHDMDVVFSLAQTISVLHYGQILVQGTPDDIRANDEVKRVYLGYRNG